MFRAVWWGMAICVWLLLGGALPAGAAGLLPAPDGGWQTSGLPYVAHVSARGCLDSLAVRGYDFLRLPTGVPGGLALMAGEQPVALTRVEAQGDTLTLDSPQATVSLRFLPDRIAVTAQNRTLADGNCLRLELRKDAARAKNPDTGAEYRLPMKAANGRVRLIAPNGAALTLPDGSLAARDDRYRATLPWVMPDGPEMTCELGIAPAPLIEDRLTVTPTTVNEDGTIWDGGPQRFIAQLENLGHTTLRGTLRLRLISYLTKTVAAELPHRFSLPRRGTAAFAYTLDGLEPGLYTAELWVEQGRARGRCGVSRWSITPRRCSHPTCRRISTPSGSARWTNRRKSPSTCA